MPPVISVSTNGSAFWEDPFVMDLLSSAQGTELGVKTSHWVACRSEVRRLENRLGSFEGDKAMSMMIRARISETETAAKTIAVEIANTASKNAVDVIWKLAISSETASAHAQTDTPETQLAASALSDLLRFVQHVQKRKSSQPTA